MDKSSRVTEINNFLDKFHLFMKLLQNNNFSIGTDEYIKVHNLLIKLASEGKLPKKNSQLQSFLAPILCKSAEEQKSFKSYFEFYFETEEIQSLQNTEIKDRAPVVAPKIWPVQRIIISITVGVSAFIIYQITKIITFSPSIFLNFIIEFYQKIIISLPLYLINFITYGFAFYIVWHIVWKALAKKYVNKFETYNKHKEDFFTVQHEDLLGIENQIFHSKSIIQSSKKFHTYIRVETERLNIDATIQKTITNGGFFSPIRGSRYVLPEYLVLIDKSSLIDYQTKYIDILISKVIENNVVFERYYFDGDPRSCYSEDKSKKSPLNLKDLALLYPDHRLMIFFDGLDLVDLSTGELVSWIDQFTPWKNKALLSLEYSELTNLQNCFFYNNNNFVVVPANEFGLESLIGKFNTNSGNHLKLEKTDNIFPSMLRGYTGKWFEQHSPSHEIIDRLLIKLEKYLNKDGYDWLCACAIYPELNWNLSLYLASQLRSSQNTPLLNKSTFEQLIRLPWFRHNLMPDWLRIELVNSLADGKEENIRKILDDLFLPKIDSNSLLGHFSLRFLKEKVLSKYLLIILQSISSKQGPFYDYIFISFMKNSLSFRVTKKLKNISKSKNDELIPSVEVMGEPEPPVNFVRTKSHILKELFENFVLIKPGNFMMGSPSSESEHKKIEAQHKVGISKSYYISATAVTQEQWRAVMGKNPSFFNKNNAQGPVELVSWYDVMDFIKKLNLIGKGNYRLPTEAEWEYACRAGTNTPFSFGKCLSANEHANYDAEYPLGLCPQDGMYLGKTVHVLSYRPNNWGLYNMHGNIWEWCEDWFGDYPDNDSIDPKGAVSGIYKVIRGGSWNSRAGNCRSAYRNKCSPSYKDNNLGFRLAKS